MHCKGIGENMNPENQASETQALGLGKYVAYSRMFHTLYSMNDDVDDVMSVLYNSVEDFLRKVGYAYEEMGYDAYISAGDTIILEIHVGDNEDEQEEFEKNVIPKVIEKVTPAFSNVVANVESALRKKNFTDATVEDATADYYGLNMFIIPRYDYITEVYYVDALIYEDFVDDYYVYMFKPHTTIAVYHNTPPDVIESTWYDLKLSGSSAIETENIIICNNHECEITETKERRI